MPVLAIMGGQNQPKPALMVFLYYEGYIWCTECVWTCIIGDKEDLWSALTSNSGSNLTLFIYSKGL